MSAALELIRAVEANGGRIRVEDGWLVIAPEDAAAPVMEELRQPRPKLSGCSNRPASRPTTRQNGGNHSRNG